MVENKFIAINGIIIIDSGHPDKLLRKQPDNFRKYEKTYRVLTPNIYVKGKHYHSKEDVKKLLEGFNVEITEKYDGANVAIYKDKFNNVYLQKRGSHLDHDHKQYVFFENWCKTHYELVKKLPMNHVYYFELLRCVHSIYYDKLDDWVVLFKIFDIKKKEFYSHEYLYAFSKVYKIPIPRLLHKGVVRDELHLEEFIPKESNYGDMAEGVVIFNPDNQMLGKVVWPGFVKMIDKFWRNKPVRYNKRKDGKLW